MSKLNLIKPEGVILNIGGTDYNLVYDFNAFAELEKQFGDVETAFGALSNSPKFSDIMKIVKAGLTSNDQVISDKELGKYLTPKNLADVVLKINEALNQAMPKQDEKDSKNQKN